MNMEQQQNERWQRDINRDVGISGLGHLNIVEMKHGKASKEFADSDAMRTAVPRGADGRPTLPPNGLTLDMPQGRELEYHDEDSHVDLFTA